MTTKDRLLTKLRTLNERELTFFTDTADGFATEISFGQLLYAMQTQKMKKADLKLLERIFEAEINGTLPAQLKSQRLPDLAKEGYVEAVCRTLPGRFPVRVKGWVLTELGRYTYCSSCG